jgi:hypothetical protein
MEIIAERILTLEPESGGQPTPIRVLLGKPERGADGEWITPYEIHGPGPQDVWKAHACGVDAMQSIVLGLFVLPHELEVRIGRLGRLTWEGSSDLGFSHAAPPT